MNKGLEEAMTMRYFKRSKTVTINRYVKNNKRFLVHRITQIVKFLDTRKNNVQVSVITFLRYYLKTQNFDKKNQVVQDGLEVNSTLWLMEGKHDCLDICLGFKTRLEVVNNLGRLLLIGISSYGILVFT